MRPATRLKRLIRDMLAMKVLLKMDMGDMPIEMYIQCLVDVDGKGFYNVEDWATYMEID